MRDVLGNALIDYNQHKRRYKLWIHNKYGAKEAMPLPVYFRNENKMSPLELLALEGCTGKILDVGAAAGCHSLILQQRQLNVTAMDLSAGACYVMQLRGIKNVMHADIFTYHQQKFDTLLFLMNGIGLAGTLNGLEKLLLHLHRILKSNGHILFDSSDVRYIYKPTKLPEHYYGEIDYCYAYRKQFSEWFKWLYVDKKTMHAIASRCGFQLDVLTEDENGVYLGRLTRIKT